MTFSVEISDQCKGNYANCVKLILHSYAHKAKLFSNESKINSYNIRFIIIISLDIIICMCKIIFTHTNPFSGGNFENTQLFKNRNLAPTRLSQPEARESRRRAVYDHRILRPVRPAAGQVRNCQTRKCGGFTYQTGCPAVRIFASNSVSIPPCIRARGDSCIAAAPTWTTPGTQAQRGNCQFLKPFTFRQAWIADCGFSEDIMGPVRTICLSQQYRPGIASSQKKTPMTTPVPEIDKQS